MGKMVTAVVLLLVCTLGAVCVHGAGTASEGFPVPSYYVFGDGYLDAGNNNFIKSFVPHANMRPYGMTAFKRPTGRFSDGLIFADLLAVVLNLPQAPPSLSNETLNQMATCVNYASGGSAILPGSSAAYGAKLAFTFEQQITQYEGDAVNVIYNFGVDQALLILNDAIYQINLGTIDILAFFTKPAYATTVGPVQTFLEALAAEYRRMIDRLYAQGARKIVVFGVGPIQKSPLALLLTSKMSPLAAKEFYRDVDSAVQQFNLKLVLMVTQLNNDSGLGQPHASLQLVFADVYGAVLDITNKPYTYGLADVKNACCGGGKFGVEIRCGFRGSKVCKAVSKALYWNDKEFTEAANEQLFRLFFEGSKFVKPFSVEFLAKLLIPGVPY